MGSRQRTSHHVPPFWVTFIFTGGHLVNPHRVAKRTLEHPRQRQRHVSDSNGEEQQKADHKQRPARDYGVAGFFTEQKVRSDDSDDYVDKGKQALSSVHSRTAPPLFVDFSGSS